MMLISLSVTDTVSSALSLSETLNLLICFSFLNFRLSLSTPHFVLPPSGLIWDEWTVATILCKCYPVCFSQHSCLLSIYQRGTLSFTTPSSIIVHIPLASCFQRLKSPPIRSCLSQQPQFLASVVHIIYFSGCWGEAPDNSKLMREDFVVAHSFWGTDHHQIREGTVAGGRCNNPQPGENCEWWCSTHFFSISISLLSPLYPSPFFPHTFLLQLEWNSTAYIEVGSSHLKLPIYTKDLTRNLLPYHSKPHQGTFQN